MIKRGFVVLIFAATSVLPNAVLADTSATAVSSADGNQMGADGQTQVNSGSGAVGSSAATVSSVGAGSPTGFAYSNASAEASVGALKASVYGSVGTPPGPYVYGVYYTTARADSFARAAWTDTVTLGGSGLAGTGGYFTASMGVSGGYGGTLGPTGPNDYAEHYDRVSVLGTGMGAGDPACGGWSYCGFEDITGAGTISAHSNVPSVITITIPFLFGYATSIGYTLDVVDTAVATTGTDGNGTSAVAFADYFHTLKWNGITGVFDAEGNPIADFTVSSASGFDYLGNVAAVPEPETYAMLLAGLGLLGWHARRRKLKLTA